MDSAQGRSSLLCPYVVDRFLRCLQNTSEEGTLDLVFHRTQASSLGSISRIGFVTPDGQSVKVVHGNRYGPGIYATWQDSYSACQKFGENLVLCLAFRGEVRERNLKPEDGVCSHVVKNRHLAVYRHGCQVLPVAVLSSDELAAEEAWQLAERIALIILEIRPLLRGKWVSKSKAVVSTTVTVFIAGKQRPMLKAFEWVAKKWLAAEKFLTADRRLQVEMRGVKDLIGEESICEVKTHTFQNSLAQWRATIQTGETAVSIGLAFPMCYPQWPPHIFLLDHLPRKDHKVPCVSKYGAINPLELVGLSSWDPGIQAKDLLEKLRPVLAEGKWERHSVNHKVTFASFCGGGKDFWAAFSESSPSTSAGPNFTLARGKKKCSPIGPMGCLNHFMNLCGTPGNQGTAFQVEFQAILDESTAMAAELGGAPNFPDGKVHLVGKVKRKEFKVYTAFEHLQLTVLGFARLSEISGEVLSLNNAATFFNNPGTQLLEKECGLTMHADRSGAVEAVKTGPELMLTVFGAAKEAGKCKDFFMKAFDRHHDPCLEGRYLLIQEFGQNLLAGEFGGHLLRAGLHVEPHFRSVSTGFSRDGEIPGVFEDVD